MTTARDVQTYRPGSLYVKRPATVTSMNRTELMTAGPRERFQLEAAARRLVHRGEVQIVSRPVWNHEAQRWTMVVRRIRPAWRRRAWIAGAVVTTLVTLFGMGWWLLAAMSGASVIGVLVTILVAFVFWTTRARGGQGSSGRIIEVITKVRIG
jgi:hypothetical protein